MVMTKIASGKEIMEAAVQITTDIFNEDGRITPVWLCINQNGERGVIGGVMPENNKDEFAAVVRQTLKDQNVVAYAFICEGWAKSAKVGQALEIPAGGIRNAPDKEEVVMICVERK